MNKLSRRKGTEILLARDETGRLLAIAGQGKELLAKNFLLDFQGNPDRWIIIPVNSITGNMQTGIAYATKQEVKDILLSYK